MAADALMLDMSAGAKAVSLIILGSKWSQMYVRHPKSHHVSELSLKKNQGAWRSKISQPVNWEHLKKSVNELIRKAMQVSWLWPRWSAWSRVAPQVTWRFFFFFNPQHRVKPVLKFHDTTLKSTTEGLGKRRLHFLQRMGHLHVMEDLA